MYDVGDIAKHFEKGRTYVRKKHMLHMYSSNNYVIVVYTID